MTRRKPATTTDDQPHLAPLKIEGQPWHEDPDIMAKLTALVTEVYHPPVDVTANLREVFDYTAVEGVVDSTTNPYLLQSSKVLGTLADEAHRARQTIAALEQEMGLVTADADFQIARIQGHRDAELAARQARVDDLMKIVAADSVVNGEKGQNNG